MKTHRKAAAVCIIAAIFVMLFCSYAFAQSQDYVHWLEEQSMLYRAGKLSEEYSGKGGQWQNPYAMPQPHKLCETASVWFTAYPASTITAKGQTIVEYLGSPKLWQTFQEIGIQALHTGPMSLGGGIVRGEKEYSPSIDGWFDRISLDVDPMFGTNEQYRAMSDTAAEHGALIAGDIIPGHTGKGADFRLAEMGYKDYPGIYHMVEINKEDWHLLPDVPKGEDTVNLPLDLIHKLKDKGYITGQLVRVIFYEPKIKETNWSATPIIKGTDGIERRWVYLHYFKTGQPTLNWLDPSYAAPRLLAGDTLQTLNVLGAKIIRLDANGFLGIEKKPGEVKCWSEGHPLSIVGCNLISMMARKFGGYTFQELNLTLENIKEFSELGADLSYDFISRPAYIHAVITQDGEFLRMMLRLMHQHEIKPVSLIHALQNHDEITYELVHLDTHPDRLFHYHGKDMTGRDLRAKIIKEAKDVVLGSHAPYNLDSGNGLCTTLLGVCAAAFQVKDPYNMTPEEKETVTQAHLLMAMFNAMQPGVFAISGWDLMGALPLDKELVKDLLADGDNRWVNRGAYDLLMSNDEAFESSAGLPRAYTLYEPLHLQLKDENSFVYRLKQMLDIRQQYKIHLAEQIAIPDVKNTGVVFMVHELPDDLGVQVTALNFTRQSVKETLKMAELKNKTAVNLLAGNELGKTSPEGEFTFDLNAVDGSIVLFK